MPPAPELVEHLVLGRLRAWRVRLRGIADAGASARRTRRGRRYTRARCATWASTWATGASAWRSRTRRRTLASGLDTIRAGRARGRTCRPWPSWSARTRSAEVVVGLPRNLDGTRRARRREKVLGFMEDLRPVGAGARRAPGTSGSPPWMAEQALHRGRRVARSERKGAGRQGGRDADPAGATSTTASRATAEARSRGLSADRLRRLLLVVVLLAARGLRRLVPRDAVAGARAPATRRRPDRRRPAPACRDDRPRSSTSLGLVRHPAGLPRARARARARRAGCAPGEYALEGALSARRRSSTSSCAATWSAATVTFPEGRNLEEMARSLAAARASRRRPSWPPRATPRSIRDLDPEATDLEGYLFPDTYDLPRAPDAAAVLVARMVQRFRERDRRPSCPRLRPSGLHAARGGDPGLASSSWRRRGPRSGRGSPRSS